MLYVVRKAEGSATRKAGDEMVPLDPDRQLIDYAADPAMSTVEHSPEACPNCGGGDFDVGYGLAGGGCGVYRFCAECSTVVGKDQDCA